MGIFGRLSGLGAGADDAAYAPPPGDILAAERTRRRRGLTARIPLLRLLNARVFAAGVVLAVAGGLGLAFWQNGSPSVRLPGGVETPVAAAAPHPEAGRALKGVEVLQAEWLGRPVRLGEGGLPVVEHGVTGEVREMTPVEVEYWEETHGGVSPFLDTGVNGVVWNPGPDGWGMWWRDNSLQAELLPDARFTRERWRDKQERELAEAAALLSLALLELEGYEVERWVEGPSARIAGLMARLRAVHPVVAEHGFWEGVPVQWLCDDGLEAAVTLGVSQGCPPAHYMDFLYEAWGRLGAVSDHLSGLARLGLVIDRLSARDYYELTARDEFLYAFLEVEDLVGRLFIALDGLRQVSVGQELPLNVRLFERVDL